MSDSAQMHSGIIGVLREKKGLLAAVAVIAVGIVLILFGTAEQSSAGQEHSEYTDTKLLETRVKTLCEQVYGVSDVTVMITMDTFGEQLYAFNAQQNSDGNNRNSRLEYVTTSGGLVPTGELMPRIRGVAVVCRGGDDPTVRLTLTEMLCALFSISSDSVSIVGSK